MHPAQRIASVPRRPTRLDVAIVLALLAWALAEALFAAGPGSRGVRLGDLVFLVFFVGGTWAVGRVVRHRATQEDAHAEVQAQAAVVAERARIARELHDVVAHSISIVSVQAAAANAYLERDPAQAREHLDAVRRTAHDALGEMRRLCGVLREDAAVLLPQPTLDRVGELVTEARHAGVELELIQEGERHELPPGLDLAAFRILQEALMNVRKHAGAVSAAVRIGYCTDGVDLEVRNAPGAGLGEPGCGHGLEGMRERARVYGGRVDAGVEPDGSFAVRARLPLHGGAPA